MKKNKKQPISFYQKLLKIKHAGITQQRPPDVFDPWQEKLSTLEERINRIFELYNKANNKPGSMIYFVMYDIENNKVRTQIAKYLKKKGCVRVQKSIFLASSTRERFDEIHADIRQVQEV